MKTTREKVFKEVSKIPKGKTKTYKEIAEKLETSPRAVAKILSTNQNPITIPCQQAKNVFLILLL